MQTAKGKFQGIEHVAFWLFIWLFVFDYYFLDENWSEAFFYTSAEVITYIALVYLNLLVIIPFALTKWHAMVYCVSLVFVVSIYVMLLRVTGLENYFYDYEGWRNVFSMVLNATLFLLISLLYWYLKQWRMEREQKLLWRNERLEAELSFLRAQISPHFIFNTLNNIYTLALRKDDNTASMVAKLSRILRYVLYEGGEQQILFRTESETLKQYIELQLLRKPVSTNVDFYTEGDPGEWSIVPMLLINFVENAFKHSRIEVEADAWIKIHSSVTAEGELLFSTENNIPGQADYDRSGGIGIMNVRRQLELNYPGSHSLHINSETGTYSVNLTLQMKHI